MRKKQFYRDKRAVKGSVSGTYLAPFLALQITGCSQMVDRDKTAQKTGQVQGTEEEDAGAEKSSVEIEKNGSRTGGAGQEQFAGSGQADAKAATSQGNSVVEFKPGMPIKEGMVAPDFAGELMNGTSIMLFKLQGKSVIINFQVTQYGLCVKEIPAFERLKGDFGDRIGIITVSCGDDTETVKDFMEENGYTFPVVLDEEYSISMLHSTNSIPHIVVLGVEGKVTHVSTEALDADTVYRGYKEALGV